MTINYNTHSHAMKLNRNYKFADTLLKLFHFTNKKKKSLVD